MRATLKHYRSVFVLIGIGVVCYFCGMLFYAFAIGPAPKATWQQIALAPTVMIWTVAPFVFLVWAVVKAFLIHRRKTRPPQGSGSH